MRTAKALGSFIVLLAGAFAAGAAHGTTWNSASGLSCQVDDGVVFYSGSGAGNSDNEESANLVCGLGLGTQSSHPRTHDHVAIRYYDNSSTNPFQCSVCQTFFGGSVSCTNPKYTCSNWGGCNVSTPPPSPSYKGEGILVWYSNELPSNVANQYVDTHYYVWCNVPPYASGGSFIQNYWAGEG
jgi:hypothetical protein